MTPRKKLIIIVLLFIGLSLLLVAYATYRALVYTATIEVKFAPSSAKVTIGGRGASAGKTQVIPGKYEIKITREGFAEYKTEVEAKKGETTLVEAVLQSNDSSTANWYQENLEDYGIAQSIGDGQADRAYDELIKKFPIAKDLPLNGLYNSYQVFYEIADNARGYAVTVDYQSAEAKVQAVQAIKGKGYKLEDYDIIYRPAARTVNNIVLPGIVTLSDHGLDKVIVDLVADRLTKTYATYGDETVTSIEFADDLNQVIDGDSDTTTVTIVINDTYKRRLTIKRSGISSYTITVSAPNGSEARRIY